ncbi:unnamed protein product [Vitrella brassicaformis CCMP3155]|uniref:Uncharacterized protein n=1 Tax=Vitrella brassicaformis (strain CCMP3155) TaxID=1169540 RepID=A0A0G4F9S7_VITBC|nr:unnamed protein product [Vitrella brassicaformis CCMP3155]|eukprot:CEM09017.1 unnamed protein product [Vitrella brassicaformis CCMP3155]
MTRPSAKHGLLWTRLAREASSAPTALAVLGSAVHPAAGDSTVPNSMNDGGVLKREMGMDAFFGRLLSDVLTPTAHRLHLLPPDATLDSHKTFTVVYQHPMGDVDLAPRFDNAEVTLNVNIAGEFTGGDLTFLGPDEALVPVGPSEREGDRRAVTVAQRPGIGVVHSGYERHQASWDAPLPAVLCVLCVSGWMD